MRFLILMISLLIAVESFASQCKALTDARWSDKQISVIKQSYEYGREFGLSNTLAAIAMTESSAGKFLVNYSEPEFPSAGIHGIMTYKILDFFHLKRNKENVKLAVNMLKENPSLSLAFAVRELKYWHKRRNGNWTLTWASYNAGNRWQNGKPYVQKINKAMELIKKCNW